MALLAILLPILKQWIIYPIQNYIFLPILNHLTTDRIRNYFIVSLILQLFNMLFKDLIKKYVEKQIKPHFSDLFKSDSNVEKLQKQTMKLKLKREKLELSVVKAKSNGELLIKEVTDWLCEANNEIDKAEGLIRCKEEVKMKKCFFGLCPNLKSRYQLSKETHEKALVIEDLWNDNPKVEQEALPSRVNEALPSRALILNEVIDALKDPNLYMLGIYGLGGVGKTTLAKEVQRKAVEDKLFDTVAMVHVSQTPDLKKIQGEIADFLGLKLDADQVPGRASQLYEMLKKSKALIILDDLWEKLELAAAGIPFGDECKGSKLLLTSRSRDVLSCEMGAQKEFSLEVLGEEEAWSLFQTPMDDANNPEYKDIGMQLAKKCLGLPLLVNKVAVDLKNKVICAWRDALAQLSDFQNEEIHEKVYKVLKSSYGNLPDKEAKSLFLLCALFGQSNIPINHLLTYAMGLGLFENIVSVKDARDRLRRSIEKLKTMCFLLDGDMNGNVKLHDIILDFARSLATKEQHAFFGTSGIALRRWPNEDCTRIALHYCNISELPEGLTYPKAELFTLFSKNLDLVIPDLFFVEIKELKVLDLTGMCLKPLPSSLLFLKNLHSLHLHQCQLDDVAIIGDLKQLEFLSFEESCIVELPRQIGKLIQLKSLNLASCTELKVIPPNILSKLSHLEELYMKKSFDGWDLNGNASFTDLNKLSSLKTLEVRVLDAKKLPNGLFSKGLERYRILIGAWDWDDTYEISKTLKLKLETSIDLKVGLKKLLSSTEDLYLVEVNRMKNGLYDLDAKGFQQLKHLHIRDNNFIRNIIHSSSDAFTKLETLSLANLSSLEEICNGQLGTKSFRKLRTLRIIGCENLRKLFSFSTAKCLSQLQELEVGYCGNLEAFVAKGSKDGNGNNEVIRFPQLSSLVLYSLPRLRGIRKQREGQTEDGLFSEMVSFPNLTRLDVSICNSLKYIFKTSPKMELNTRYKVTMRLRHLTVKNMPSLKRIWSADANGVFTFPDLKSVEVSICEVLEYVFPASLASGLLQLEELIVEKCGVEHIVGMPESVDPAFKLSKLKYLKLLGCERANQPFLLLAKVSPNLQTLVLGGIKSKEIQGSEFPNGSFSKLKVVELSELDEDCGFLRILWSLEKLVLKNSSLEELFTAIVRLQCMELIKVNNLKHIWKEDSIFPSEYLQTLNVDSCSHLMKIAASSVSFQNLTTLHVSCCHKLENLVAPSTAKTMVHLIELRIENCEMVTEIVANGGDDTEHDEIIFNQLKRLRLSHLPTLISFCSRNNCTFHFPSLEQVIISECPKMTIFCGGNLITPKLGSKEDSRSSNFWKGISMGR